jgi:quinol monooxygenase YgiN
VLPDADPCRGGYIPLRSSTQEVTMQTQGKIAFTVTWEARDGEADAAAEIIARFAPEARKEVGLELLTVNRSTANPAQFLFYEIFTDEAAFEAHQQTPHFRTMILEDALPRLSKRERVQYTPL